LFSANYRIAEFGPVNADIGPDFDAIFQNHAPCGIN
jgi:hypothetical protein